ncbi:RNA polymerase II transcription elongation factor-domain-containing protein [Russula vinacea]|nr:RNA polymerase II transcription elongation factor-domain-containing protein [Russula vinacea]
MCPSNNRDVQLAAYPPFFPPSSLPPSLMATASSWMPATGRHNVRIGSSLSKALKARKGQPPALKGKLPERDFYALRYNHKPASIDPSKPGTLEVNPGREVTTVRVERPTVNNNEVIVFKGDEKPAKEWECVLIYDEATQTFTLEKLDSLVNLNFDAKAPPRTRPAASPPSLSSSSAAQTPQRPQARTAADELEAELEGSSTGLGTGIDANGKSDSGSFSLARDEEEEGEGGEVVVNGNGGAVVAPSPPQSRAMDDHLWLIRKHHSHHHHSRSRHNHKLNRQKPVLHLPKNLHLRLPPRHSLPRQLACQQPQQQPRSQQLLRQRHRRSDQGQRHLRHQRL